MFIAYFLDGTQEGTIKELSSPLNRLLVPLQVKPKLTSWEESEVPFEEPPIEAYDLVDGHKNILFYLTNRQSNFGRKIVALAAEHILTVHTNSINQAIAPLAK